MRRAGDNIPLQMLTENRHVEVKEGRRTKDGWLPCRWDLLRLSDGDGREKQRRKTDDSVRKMLADAVEQQVLEEIPHVTFYCEYARKKKNNKKKPE